MSRQSKNARNLARAKACSEVRKSGGRGPAKTSPQHGKTKAWWQLFRSFGEFAAGKGKKSRDVEA